MAGEGPIILSYATPRVFLEGIYRTRTVWSVLMAALLGVIGIMLAIRWWPLTSVMGGLTVLCLILSVSIIAVPFVLGPMIRVRITEDGIEFGREFWDWRDVSYLGCSVVGDYRVDLFFAVRRCFPPRQQLPITPRLRWREYVRLMGKLRSYLSEHHPHVTVETTDVKWPSLNT